MRQRGRFLVLMTSLLGLGLCVPGTVDGQERQQRATPGREPAAQTPGQAEALMQRFGQRVAQALQLDAGQARRLQRELQISRRERTRVMVRTRDLRRELNQLIRNSPADESRVAQLLDELMTLGLQAAQIPVDEQRRLSVFLSPLQRARYLYLRQRLTRQALDRQGAQTDVPPRINPDPDLW
jgi:hypothetical protein